jgi:hypothetical protein
MDDAAPLAFMAPGGTPGQWRAVLALARPGNARRRGGGSLWLRPARNLCGNDGGGRDLAARPPVWINLEYLSAEPYVARCHGLPSPQRNGLTKWFFYPGFTAATGGLLREPGLQRHAKVSTARAWLAGLGAQPAAGERVVSLFCYDNPALAGLAAGTGPPTHAAAADAWPRATAGGSSARRRRASGALALAHAATALTTCCGPATSTSCAARTRWCARLWAGAPFVWQAYPQADGAHIAKVDGHAGRSPPAATGRRNLACLERLARRTGTGAARRPRPCMAGSSRRWPGAPTVAPRRSLHDTTAQALRAGNPRPEARIMGFAPPALDSLG